MQTAPRLVPVPCTGPELGVVSQGTPGDEPWLVYVVNSPPLTESIYRSGVDGSVDIPVTHGIVSVSCLTSVEDGSIVIAGGDTIVVPAGCGFSEEFADAPIMGIGPGSVVFTETDRYFVRARPVT